MLIKIFHSLEEASPVPHLHNFDPSKAPTNETGSWQLLGLYLIDMYSSGKLHKALLYGSRVMAKFRYLAYRHTLGEGEELGWSVKLGSGILSDLLKTSSSGIFKLITHHSLQYIAWVSIANLVNFDSCQVYYWTNIFFLCLNLMSDFFVSIRYNTEKGAPQEKGLCTAVHCPEKRTCHEKKKHIPSHTIAKISAESYSRSKT